MNRTSALLRSLLAAILAMCATGNPAIGQDPGGDPPAEHPLPDEEQAEGQEQPQDENPPATPEQNAPDPSQMERRPDMPASRRDQPRPPAVQAAEQPNPQAAHGAEPAAAPTPHPFVALELARDGQPLGRVVVELYPDIAPKTVANFLHYVDARFYNGTIFHRMLPDYVIQGGGYTALDQLKKDGLQPPIANEAKPTQRHLRGTIAAARLHRDLNSATSQFFINLTDNRRLDRHSYAVFGKVVEGMEVIDRAVEQTELTSSPLEPAFQTRPSNPPTLVRAHRMPADYKPPAESPATPESGAAQRATGAMPANPAAGGAAESAVPAASPNSLRSERPRPDRRPRTTTPVPSAAPAEEAQPEATPPDQEATQQPKTSRTGGALPGTPAQPLDGPKPAPRKAPPNRNADPS